LIAAQIFLLIAFKLWAGGNLQYNQRICSYATQ